MTTPTQRIVAAAEALAAPLRFQDPDNLSVDERALLEAFDGLAAAPAVAGDGLADAELAEHRTAEFWVSETELELLDDLESRAKPGPWRHDDPDGDPDNRIIAANNEMVAGNYDYEVGGIIDADDTEFIIVLRNIAPRLVAALRAAYAERDQAQALAQTRLDIINAQRDPDLAANYAQVRKQRDDLRAAVARAEQATAEARRTIAEELNAEATRIRELGGHPKTVMAYRTAGLFILGMTSVALAADVPAAAERPGEVWDSSVPPGGYVCATCGVPTESEPCDEHGPAAATEEERVRDWYNAIPTSGDEPTVEEHPERTCNRCGGPNIPWTAPSPLWNQVMRDGDINGTEIHDGIVCPTCFATLAEERGIADLWKFYAERVHVPLQTVTPSGRVWDAEKWLWGDPPRPDGALSVECPTCGSGPGQPCIHQPTGDIRLPWHEARYRAADVPAAATSRRLVARPCGCWTHETSHRNDCDEKPHGAHREDGKTWTPNHDDCAECDELTREAREAIHPDVLAAEDGA